ncbi:hypothetical protein Vadar_031906 [Vaccinium darrowii]|uniref:Uncharacterized protein n=1 Tax=Vaccinium darrowii TaxID=229202 RepID=A0ACB7YHU2_9ERIC|nr:hypothetical protein Vadar_031906 [Vaccinium darrowii]
MVQNLPNTFKVPEVEIYDVLKQRRMVPNEASVRILSQGVASTLFPIPFRYMYMHSTSQISSSGSHEGSCSSGSSLLGIPEDQQDIVQNQQNIFKVPEEKIYDVLKQYRMNSYEAGVRLRPLGVASTLTLVLFRYMYMHMCSHKGSNSSGSCLQGIPKDQREIIQNLQNSFKFLKEEICDVQKQGLMDPDEASITSSTSHEESSSSGSSLRGIPEDKREIVQNLPNAFDVSEEEIYDVLKQCRMDPDKVSLQLLSRGVASPLSLVLFRYMYMLMCSHEGRSNSGSSLQEIPEDQKEIVQNLQNSFKVPEEEISDVLKQCHMDPNEAGVRILSRGVASPLSLVLFRYMYIHSTSHEGSINSGSGLQGILEDQREIVLNLQNSFKIPEEEIYDVLKQCRMVLNEAGVRILSRGVAPLSPSFCLDICVCMEHRRSLIRGATREAAVVVAVYKGFQRIKER